MLKKKKCQSTLYTFSSMEPNTRKFSYQHASKVSLAIYENLASQEILEESLTE